MPAKRVADPVGWSPIVLASMGCSLLAGLLLMLARLHAAVTTAVYVSDVAFGVVWTLTGLLAWKVRPGSRSGRLMLVLGLVVFANASYGWRLPTSLPLHPVLTVLGLAGFWFGVALAAQLLLTYPTGRPTGRVEVWFLRVAYASAAVVTLGQLVVYTPDVTVCGDRCQVSPIRLVENHTLSSAVFAAASAWFAVLAVICVALIIRRARIGGSRWRRQRTLIAMVAVVAVGGEAAVLALNAFNQSARHGFGWLLYVVTYVITLVLPVAFVVGLLRDRAGYASVADLVRGLDQIETRELEAGLAKTLQDPAMKLVFPVGGAFVDVEGHRVPVPNDSSRRVTMLGPKDAPVAALIHDPVVLESPKLLQAAAAAAHLALSNARLQAEVRAQLSEVKSSRGRIIAAADEERRRIERNLHDGAQQRLLVMGMTLHLLRSQLDDYTAARETLDEAESALRQAIEELRELAQGIHPAVLTDEGLLAAVGLLARRSPIAVRIDAELDTRPTPNIEAAAYYIISEALQNIAKHAHAKRASVRLRCIAGHLDIKVTDDGVGGVFLQAGSGVRGMEDRTLALDGIFQIRSEPGTGTEVRVSLPCG